MQSTSGEAHRRTLPRQRNLVLDLMHHSLGVPTVTEDRILDLSEVAKLRAVCDPASPPRQPGAEPPNEHPW